MNTRGAIASVLVLLAGCGDDNNRLLDAGADDLGGVEKDAPTVDLGRPDAGGADAGLDVPGDRGAADAGSDVADDRGSSSLDVGASDVGGDASSDRPDVAVVDAGAPDAGTADAAVDASPTDVVVADAGTPDAGAADAAVDASSPRGTPTIDGVIGADWPAGALVATNTVTSAWGGALNSLRSIRVAWDATRLYLGIDGAVEASNAMLVFIDRDYVVGSTATGATQVSTLTDGMGSLDNSISCNVNEAPAGFGVDMVWGTRGMLSAGATELREAVGLREVGCTACRGDFRWTMGATTACVGGASPACEVSIEWTALYGGAPPPLPALGLFVRITNAEGNDLSNNQCLPQQAAGDPPTAARQVLSFAPRF